MFEENENNYPVKPEYIVDHSGRNRMMFFITVVAIFILSGDFIRDSYMILLELLGVFLIHELGHFLAARLFKIRVDKFYLFFDFLFHFQAP